jgi:hypothetical protein
MSDVAPAVFVVNDDIFIHLPNRRLVDVSLPGLNDLDPQRFVAEPTGRSRRRTA